MKLGLSIACLAASLAAPLAAQPADQNKIVTLYRAAPGHQLQLLQWLARQDAAGRAAGLPASQLYVHQNGASWDFMIISPVATPEQDRATEAELKRMGGPSGPKLGLEMRQHVAEHSDTFVAGPTTAADWLKRIEQ